MPVLVDPLRRYDHVRLSVKDWCHMAVDGSFEELHAFAAGLGIPRHRFQGDHYDLPPWLRDRAVELGAEEVATARPARPDGRPARRSRRARAARKAVKSAPMTEQPYFDDSGRAVRRRGRFVRPTEDVAPLELIPGLRFQPVTTDAVMTNFVTFEPDADAAMHHHAEQQIAIIVSGELTFTVGGETRVMRPGDLVVIPPHVPHGGVAGPRGLRRDRRLHAAAGRHRCGRCRSGGGPRSPAAHHETARISFGPQEARRERLQQFQYPDDDQDRRRRAAVGEAGIRARSSSARARSARGRFEGRADRCRAGEAGREEGLPARRQRRAFRSSVITTRSTNRQGFNRHAY